MTIYSSPKAFFLPAKLYFLQRGLRAVGQIGGCAYSWRPSISRPASSAVPGNFSTPSRQVMNPPGDRPEAGNLANTAPRQSDHDDARRGLSGMTAWSEARPVTATAHISREATSPRLTARGFLSGGRG
jgi:hypothetical protein